MLQIISELIGWVHGLEKTNGKNPRPIKEFSVKDTELLPFLRYLGRLFQLFCDLETCIKHTVYGDTHQNRKSRQLTSFTIAAYALN